MRWPNKTRSRPSPPPSRQLFADSSVACRWRTWRTLPTFFPLLSIVSLLNASELSSRRLGGGGVLMAVLGGYCSNVLFLHYMYRSITTITPLPASHPRSSPTLTSSQLWRVRSNISHLSCSTLSASAFSEYERNAFFSTACPIVIELQSLRPLRFLLCLCYPLPLVFHRCQARTSWWTPLQFSL